jgi:hypothetical protein
MSGKSRDSWIVVWKVIRKGILYAGFAPTLLLTCYAGFAQVYPIYLTVVAPAPVARVDAAPPVAAAPPAGSVPTAQAPKPLDGLGFGAGLALSFGQSRVNSAVAVGPNNIVRVTDNSNVLAGIVFETHYFFVPPATQLLGSALPITWGHGPFIAVDASTSATTGSAVVAGISLGWMVGFRRLTLPATQAQPVAVADNNSWNFGIGFRVDPRGTVLGDGIVANMPLPAGETNPVRLKSEPRYGVMFLTSYAF